MADDRNRFRIVVMNVGGGHVKKNQAILRRTSKQRETLRQIIQNQNPHIVFFQELKLDERSVRTWLNGLEAHYCYIRHEEASIVYDERLFTAVPLKPTYLEWRLRNIVNNFEPLTRMTVLEITIKKSLQKFLCISWHGPYKVTEQLKLRWFENLIAFLEGLLIKYGLPLIVGGDFNITAEYVKGLVSECFRLEYCNDGCSRNGPIDFYIISNDLKLDDLRFVDFTDGNPGFLDHKPLSTLLIVPGPKEVIGDPLDYILEGIRELELR